MYIRTLAQFCSLGVQASYRVSVLTNRVTVDRQFYLFGPRVPPLKSSPTQLDRGPGITGDTREASTQGLTDSKAMEIHCTRPSRTPTAPCDSCPGSRLGSGSSLHSGCNICRKEEML